MGQPAARVGDPHVCPMFDGLKPHVGGPVLPPGKITVFIGGMPASTITDRCFCVSAPDIIIQGAQTVLINGLMAARMGDATAHGGRIILGCPTVLIGGPTFTDASLLALHPPKLAEPSNGEVATSLALDLIPVVGTLKGLLEGITGHDAVTGEKLSVAERLIGWVPYLGKAGRVVKGGGKLLRAGEKVIVRETAREVAKKAARERAAELLATRSNRKMPRAVTAIEDKKTGKIYYGESKKIKDPSNLHPDVQRRLPSENLEKHSPHNCAEVDALDQALKDGANIEDLEQHTVKIENRSGEITDYERCENCKVTTHDITTTSDPHIDY